MELESKELPPIGTNAYVVMRPEKKTAVVVDAPMEAFSWAKEVAEKRGCELTHLLLTHGHWDHMLDGCRFADAGVRVLGHEADRVLFESPEVMASYAMPGLDMRPVRVDQWIKDEERVAVGGWEIEIRHVPGHCPGNVLFYLPEAGVAFPGDVIFAGGVGRYDLPGGDLATLEASIRRAVYTLPDETVLYPGHGPTTTVAAEKAGNPFVRA